VKVCDACLPALEREALFSVARYGNPVGFVCVKHASEIRSKEGVKLALLAAEGTAGDEFPALPGPPIEGYTPAPAPELELRPLTVDECTALERHARDAGAGVCTLEAAELLELVIGYRCLLALSELVREFKGPRP
jgi:hypothetical protein